jgi:uncharacterized small protein (DUF1192 family)
VALPRRTSRLVADVFGASTPEANEFDDDSARATDAAIEASPTQLAQLRLDELNGRLSTLRAFIERLEAMRDAAAPGPPVSLSTATSLDHIQRICSRFVRTARQLRYRPRGRQGFGVDDEDDVRDLLHALLRLFFDDVRVDEHTPSYAAAPRTAFFVNDGKIGLEAKLTRKGLEEKQIAEQLIVDVARFKAHTSCETLVCFVYDPDGRLGNPPSLEAELNRQYDGLDVRVLVFPKD